jgi:hypothetical protein
MPTTPPLVSGDTSRRGSVYPEGDFRNSAIEEVNDVKCEVMVNWLRSKQESHLWTIGEEDEGVVLKKSRGMYTCAPIDLADERTSFFQAVQTLNVKVGWPMQHGLATYR